MVQAPMALGPTQIAALDASQRAAYFRSLPPTQQVGQMEAYRAYQATMNRTYMKNTIRHVAVCPQSSGSALSQAFSAGQQLAYTIPSAQNAFTEGIFVRMTLSVTLAAGASAAYVANAAWPLNLLDNILVQYNGVQARLRPYILRHIQQLSGQFQPTLPYNVIAGQSVASTMNYLNTAINFNTTGSVQTLNVEFYMPFNILHPQDVRGLLPTMGGETVAQVLITCASQPLGVDPVLNPVSAGSGSGHAVTITGNVAVYAVYRDGQTFGSPVLLGLDLSGQGTTQYVLDIPLTNLTANTINRQKLSVMDKCYWVISTVIDGNQSNRFTANSNIQVLEFDKDSVGSNLFWKYGIGTNLSTVEFFTQLYLLTKQNLDEGVIPWITAPIFGEADASNLGGTQILDTSLSGWTDAHYGVQLGSVGSVVGINPRVETHVILVNSAGLVNA